MINWSSGVRCDAQWMEGLTWRGLASLA